MARRRRGTTPMTRASACSEPCTPPKPRPAHTNCQGRRPASSSRVPPRYALIFARARVLHSCDRGSTHRACTCEPKKTKTYADHDVRERGACPPPCAPAPHQARRRAACRVIRPCAIDMRRARGEARREGGGAPRQGTGRGQPPRCQGGAPRRDGGGGDGARGAQGGGGGGARRRASGAHGGGACGDAGSAVARRLVSRLLGHRPGVCSRGGGALRLRLGLAASSQFWILGYY